MSHFMRGCLIATLNYSIKGLQFIISTFKNAAIATFKRGYSFFFFFSFPDQKTCQARIYNTQNLSQFQSIQQQNLSHTHKRQFQRNATAK